MRPPRESRPSLEPVLAHGKWPTEWVADDVFRAYVAEREREDAAPGESELASLYLACACVRRVPAALRAFDAEFVVEIERAAQRTRLPHDAVADVTQALRQDLLIGADGTRPKLAEYRGHGDLRGWLRVTATRAAVKISQRAAKRPVVSEDRLAELQAAGGDADLQYLKALYGEAFREAFRAAVGDLDPRDRNVLRQHFLEGMTIDDLGATYQVHRATAARWIQAAREHLLKGTRDAFSKTARLKPAECDSVIRLLESRLDLTLQRFLG